METQTKDAHTGAAFSLHPEIELALTAFLSKHPPAALPTRGDWKALKESSNVFYVNLNKYFSRQDGIQQFEYSCRSNDGAEIRTVRSHDFVQRRTLIASETDTR